MFNWFARFWSTPPLQRSPEDLGRAFAESGAAFMAQNMVTIHIETSATGLIERDESQINVAGGTQ
jgi:hypothetical protein